MDTEQLDSILSDIATKKAGDVDSLAELIGRDPEFFAIALRRILVCPHDDLADNARSIKDDVIDYIKTLDKVVAEARAEYLCEYGDDEPVDAMHEAGHKESDFG